MVCSQMVEILEAEMRRGRVARNKRRQKTEELAKERAKRSNKEQLEMLNKRGVKAVRERKRLEQKIASDQRRQR